MALLFDHSCLYPSFKESALRSSIDQTSERPLDFSVSLLYPDTNKRSLVFRRRHRSSSSAHHKVVKTPAKMAHLLCKGPASSRLLPSPPVSPVKQVQPLAQYVEPQPIPQVQHQQQQQPVAPVAPVAQTSPAPTPSPVPQGVPLMAPTLLPRASPLLSTLSPITPPRCTVEPIKVCISCKSSQSPCWRPSWDPEAGQLCNSCGLRYKKTGARCLNLACGKIPSKGEWSTMKRFAKCGPDGEPKYLCLGCRSVVELR